MRREWFALRMVWRVWMGLGCAYPPSPSPPFPSLRSYAPFSSPLT